MGLLRSVSSPAQAPSLSPLSYAVRELLANAILSKSLHKLHLWCQLVMMFFVAIPLPPKCRIILVRPVEPRPASILARSF